MAGCEIGRTVKSSLPLTETLIDLLFIFNISLLRS